MTSGDAVSKDRSKIADRSKSCRSHLGVFIVGREARRVSRLGRLVVLDFLRRKTDGDKIVYNASKKCPIITHCCKFAQTQGRSVGRAARV